MLKADCACAAPSEPAKKPEAPAPAKAEGASQEGGSPLAPVLGTVSGIILVAIAAFSSNAKSAEAYEAEKEKEKTKVEAGGCSGYQKCSLAQKKTCLSALQYVQDSCLALLNLDLEHIQYASTWALKVAMADPLGDIDRRNKEGVDRQCGNKPLG